MNSKRILIFIILLGFSLRLIRLGDRGIWYDDAFSFFLAERSLSEIIKGTAADTMPPLYYFLLHFWMGLGKGIFNLRFLSVIFSLLIVPLSYSIGRGLFGERAGLFSALLVAISPLHIYHAQELRMYGLLCLSQLLYLRFFIRCWREQPLSNPFSWAGLIISGTAAMYSHNLAILTLLAADLFALKDMSLLKRLLASQILILLLASPWLLILPGQILKVQQAFWTPRPGIVEVIQTILVFTTNLPLPPHFLPVALFGSMAFLGLCIYESFRSGPREEEILLSSFIFSPLVAMFVLSYIMRPVYLPRGAILSSVAYLVLLASTLARGKVRACFLISSAFLVLSVLPYHYSFSFFPRSPFEEVAAFLGENLHKGDVIIHDNKLSYFPCHYYDRSLAQYFIADPPGSPNDTLSEATMEAMGLFPATLEDITRGRRRIWFVAFQRAVDEARALGGELPNKAWLKSRFRLVDFKRFGDLNVYLYEAGRIPASSF
jgi:hypothetical protein